jgi:A/G-specific adenine glycosylase
MLDFSSLITRWYNSNCRDLPWRNTRNPYLIWISEIILQQTRVDQGLPYYHKFVENYPTVIDLANANEQDILKLWQGLGYYSRARNLHTTAKIIRDKYAGIFPSSFEELKKLKGVGDYTAAAIASFAFDKPHAVVDGNVYRVLSRVFSISDPIDSSKGKKRFQEIANELITPNDPGTHNQAIMEIGARVCTPSNPSCINCPLVTLCSAYSSKTISHFPVKQPKSKPRSRYFEYLVLSEGESLLLKKRGPSDIWQNLYDFPSIEFTQAHEPEQVAESAEWKHYFKGKKVNIEKISRPVKHVLSHQVIFARFWKINVKGKLSIADAEFISNSELRKYPVPRLIDRYLEKEI